MEAVRNVVLIVADTFRRDHLGCYGGTAARTPHLDQLAALWDGKKPCGHRLSL